MKKNKYLLVIVIGLIFVGICAITNPSYESHLDAYKKNWYQRDSKLAHLYNLGLGPSKEEMKKINDLALGLAIRRKNFILFSLTITTGNSRIVGLGMFEHVWIWL